MSHQPVPIWVTIWHLLLKSVRDVVTYLILISIVSMTTRSVITPSNRDGKFGIQIRSDWPEMGQIWGFLRSVSVHFGSESQNVLKLILKSPKFVPNGATLTQFGWQICNPWRVSTSWLLVLSPRSLH